MFDHHHHYSNKSIVFSVFKKDWNKTRNIFEKLLKQKGISKEHILQLSEVLDNNYDIILSLTDGPDQEHTGSEQQQQTSSSYQDQNGDGGDDDDKTTAQKALVLVKINAQSYFLISLECRMQL